MQHRIATTKPFSFAQTLAFVRRFPPCQGEYLLAADSLTAAIVAGDRAVPFTLRAVRGELVVETTEPAVVQRAADFVGASDELGEFYAAAASDAAMRPLLELLHGLHHVRFLTLAEIAVYSVMMQRAPIAMASRMKRRFLDRFGIPVEVGGVTLRAMPDFAALVALDGEVIGEAIGNAYRGESIATVVRGVAAIGESRLRDAPYAEARDALLAVRGIGPFSAAAILLRGLGRMDETPIDRFADTARVIYGAAFDAQAIARRYGRHVGYWSFYLKTGVPRVVGRDSARRAAVAQ